jgi:hypothetical protein
MKMNDSKKYIGIDPRKALVATLATLGLFIGYEFEEKGIQREIRETYSTYLEQEIQEQVDLKQSPSLRDVNKDGLEDVVLKLNSGEDLILYRTNGGYQFQDPQRRR